MAKYAQKWVVISPQDEFLLRIVNDFGVVSAEHLYALMNKSDQYTSRRILKLTNFGYLNRAGERINFGSYNYTLGPKGITELKKLNLSPKRRVFSFHTLYRAQVRACIMLACRDSGLNLTHWHAEDRFGGRIQTNFKEWHISLIPDDFFIIEKNGKPHFFFVEVDLSSSSKTHAQKMKDYEVVWRLAIKKPLTFQGHTFDDFTVLSIIDTEPRMEAMKKATKIDEPALCLFATYDKFDINNPLNVLGEIWEAPDDTKHPLV